MIMDCWFFGPIYLCNRGSCTFKAVIPRDFEGISGPRLSRVRRDVIMIVFLSMKVGQLDSNILADSGIGKQAFNVFRTVMARLKTNGQAITLPYIIPRVASCCCLCLLLLEQFRFLPTINSSLVKCHTKIIALNSQNWLNKPHSSDM